MTCPICDQKPANCDCTKTEREQHSEIERLTLTDEERDAVRFFATYGGPAHRANTLRKLLERLG